MSSVARLLPGAAFSALLAAVLAATAMPAAAAKKKQPLTSQSVAERSVSGTIIQPTTTIIPDGNGHNKIIVIPRRRSYLDTGTEVSVGDRTFQDYVLPPGGDPGRPYWFYGPDFQGTGRRPLPSAFDGTGLNPNTPF
jgi:hypothetical protein